MIYKDFYPFYTSYANPLLYRGEKEQEEEFFLMKSYYPDTARKIQEKVEEECDLRIMKAAGFTMNILTGLCCITLEGRSWMK